MGKRKCESRGVLRLRNDEEGRRCVIQWWGREDIGWSLIHFINYGRASIEGMVWMLLD
jgi:hypothetical protein